MSIRVAIIGGGPAGIYAADILTKSEADVSVDILERLPAPFGLVRYGVAPDHPRIKEIIKALDRVLAKDEIRFLGNVNYGVDVKLDDLREFYDASSSPPAPRPTASSASPARSTRSRRRLRLLVRRAPRRRPHVGLRGATSVAVVGVGNVALDVARVLAKTAEEMLVTDIPVQVYEASRPSRSPTCTSSPAAARRTRSSLRWSCASSTTRPTWR